MARGIARLGARAGLRGLLAAACFVACSVPERTLHEAPPDASTAGVGGLGAGGGDGGTGGEAGCGQPGTLRCNADARESCGDDGEWSRLPQDQQCSGDQPACTGAGVCTSYRVTGTMEPAAPPPTPETGAKYRVREQALLTLPRTCNADYCVTGGIRP